MCVGFVVLIGTAAAERLGPRLGGLFGSDVIKPFIKRFPSGVFGVCLFNLVAFLWLERLGLPLTVVLAYGVDIAYVAPAP